MKASTQALFVPVVVVPLCEVKKDEMSGSAGERLIKRRFEVLKEI